MGDKSPKSKERQKKQDVARKHEAARVAGAKAAPPVAASPGKRGR